MRACRKPTAGCEPYCPLPRTRICDSDSKTSSQFKTMTSFERSPCNNIRPTMAKSEARYFLVVRQAHAIGTAIDRLPPIGLPHYSAALPKPSMLLAPSQDCAH
jgi:hypothetical protein